MKLEYYYNKEFMDILISITNELNLNSLYKLNSEYKYPIDYILDIIISISDKKYFRYNIPMKLINYLNLSQYSSYDKTAIKQCIKKQIKNENNNHILKNYVVIGYNDIMIKELTIIL